MAKTRNIVFKFDERSLEPLEKLMRQGRAGVSTDPRDYQELLVTNPKTGIACVIIVPKYGKSITAIRDDVARFQKKGE